MKWYARVAIYVIKETVQPALSSFGTKVGEALGTKLGKRIELTTESNDPERPAQPKSTESNDPERP